MTKHTMKQILSLLLTLVLVTGCLAPSFAEGSLRADAILMPIDSTATQLTITSRAFQANGKALVTEKQAYYQNRLKESLENGLKSGGIGKGIPTIADYIDKACLAIKNKAISSVNSIGKWGMDKFAELALNKPNTMWRKGHKTLKYIRWERADRMYRNFEKLANFKMEGGSLKLLGRTANFGVGIYGFSQMIDNPTVGHRNPFLEWCANSIRGIGNTASVVSAFVPAEWQDAIGAYADAFLVADIVLNSPIVVDIVNDSLDMIRDYDTANGHEGALGYLIEAWDFINTTTESINLEQQKQFGNIINWWDYLVHGIDATEHDRILEEWDKKAKGDTFQGNGVGVYKPNIYLYPAQTADIAVTFARPELLTVTDPPYQNGWQVTAQPDGTLETDGGSYGYLFYESLTDPSDYQTTDGFVIPAENREAVFTQILRGYGLNAAEIADFNKFWCSKLETGRSYAMYPQLGDTLDVTMPLTVSPAPDSIGRIWFAFEKDAVPQHAAKPEAFARDGFTVIEWGGFFLHPSDS